MKTAGRLAALALWALGLALLVLRWWHLDADPLPLSVSGDLLTDEGWYSKAALLKARFGVWTTPGDFNPVAYSALHGALLWLAFTLGGVSAVTARATCLALYTVATVALAVACGRRLRAWPAAGLLLCLLSGHFLVFVYSRLALVDISAGSMATLALAVWLLGPTRRVGAWQVLALGFAGAAVLCKLSYLAIWGVVLLATLNRLCLPTATATATAAATPRWPRGLAVGLVALAPLVVLLALRLGLPDDWRSFQALNVASRWPKSGWAGYPGRWLGLLALAWNFLRWRALGPALVVVLLLASLARRRVAPVAPGASETLEYRETSTSPATGSAATLADTEAWWMPTLWLLGTLGQLALQEYWPWRYLLILLVPCAWLLVLALLTALRRLALPPRLGGFLAGTVGLALLAAAWGQQYQDWATNPWRAAGPQHSFAALAAQMRALPEFRAAAPVVIAGDGAAATMALYLPGAYPVSLLYPGDLCRFLAQAHTKLLVLNAYLSVSQQAEARVAACPQMAGAALVGSGTLLWNYRGQGPTLVLRLAPSSASAPHGPGDTLTPARP